MTEIAQPALETEGPLGEGGWAAPGAERDPANTRRSSGTSVLRLVQLNSAST